VASNYGFFGNPNITCTSIDTTGGIASSRTTGELPFFVQVSASAMVINGTSLTEDIRSYEDAEYRWDFGDPSGAETFYQPIRFTAFGPCYGPHLANMNDDQYGPEAAYCYRTAGTYTITLYIRASDGAGGYITASKTLDVTASAWTGTDQYWDSVDGSDAYDGTSPTIGGGSGPKQTVAALRTAMTSGTNKRFFLAKGSTWTFASAGGSGRDQFWDKNTGLTHMRIAAYSPTTRSATAKPIIENNSAANSDVTIGFSNQTASQDDIVFSDIEVKRSGAVVASIFGIAPTTDTNKSTSNIYCDNVSFTAGSDMTRCTGVQAGWFAIDSSAPYAGTVNNPTGYNTGFWGGDITTSTTHDKGDTGLHEGPFKYLFVYGMDITGAGVDAAASHHMYLDVTQHAVVKYCRFFAGGKRNYCVKMSYNSTSDDAPSRWHLCSDNDMQRTATAWTKTMSAPTTGDGLPPTVHTDNVCARNAMHDFQNSKIVTVEEITPGSGNAAGSMTMRDNVIWNVATYNNGTAPDPGSSIIRTYAPNLSQNTNSGTIEVYFNKVDVRFYRNYAAGELAGTSYPTIDAACNSGSGRTDLLTPWQVTDNVLVYSSANARMWSVASYTNLTTIGMLIDRNQYYMAGYSNIAYDGTTLKTFAQWQALDPDDVTLPNFDANGSFASSSGSFLSPQSGDFRTQASDFPLMLMLRARVHS
jgi:hypothetical protein